MVIEDFQSALIWWFIVFCLFFCLFVFSFLAKSNIFIWFNIWDMAIDLFCCDFFSEYNNVAHIFNSNFSMENSLNIYITYLSRSEIYLRIFWNILSNFSIFKNFDVITSKISEILRLSCQNFWDKSWWFLSLRVFGLLSSSLFHKVSADMSSGFLQVFVELGNLHGTSNYFLLLNTRGSP